MRQVDAAGIRVMQAVVGDQTGSSELLTPGYDIDLDFGNTRTHFPAEIHDCNTVCVSSDTLLKLQAHQVWQAAPSS
jgi:hypothetical protein